MIRSKSQGTCAAAITVQGGGDIKKSMPIYFFDANQQTKSAIIELIKTRYCVETQCT